MSYAHFYDFVVGVNRRIFNGNKQIRGYLSLGDIRLDLLDVIRFAKQKAYNIIINCEREYLPNL